MTLDMLLEALRAFRAESPLAGETMVYLCDPDVEYRRVTGARIEVDADGAVVLLRASQPGEA